LQRVAPCIPSQIFDCACPRPPREMRCDLPQATSAETKLSCARESESASCGSNVHQGLTRPHSGRFRNLDASPQPPETCHPGYLRIGDAHDLADPGQVEGLARRSGDRQPCWHRNSRSRRRWGLTASSGAMTSGTQTAADNIRLIVETSVRRLKIRRIDPEVSDLSALPQGPPDILLEFASDGSLPQRQNHPALGSLWQKTRLRKIHPSGLKPS